MTRAEFDEVVDLVSNGITTGRGARGAYVHHDAVNGEVRGRKGARLAAVTSGGAIPETGDYRVVAEPDDTFIGTVNEDWAVESMAGDIFLLGTHSWQIKKVETGVVRVRDAGTAPPTIPFWMGEAPARTAELSWEVSELRAAVDAFLTAGDPDGARRWLIEHAGIDLDAATMVVDYLAVARAALGAMPTQHQLVLERFFDETGGMQLVVHSPFGGRINRGLGLALRKKFCRTFNFELQAAASDDAIVLSLGPHHSFPLQEVPGYLQSATVDDTLQHAILDSPMFLSRWRWNLNRSLIVLRFRGGRRNPPPIQRMESDDLMAAVFPQAAACQENVTGPIEIPDHILVRQTIGDTLHEALDVDGVRELLERMEAGAVTVHFADTTEPSVLAHEILTARPYAFLDDEELQNRRTNAVTLRRGLAVDLASIGALDPDAIAQVHGEITPEPVTADDLHDLLASLVVVRPRADWRASFDELTARGRATVLEHAGQALWCTTERTAEATLAFADDEDAIASVLRGHLEIAGITDTAALADGHHAHADRACSPVWRTSSRAASCCRVTTPTTRSTPSGCRAGCWRGCTPTHAARAGAGSSPRPRRTSCASSSAGTTWPPAPSSPVRRACSRWSSSSRATTPPRWRGSPSCSRRGCAGTNRPGSTVSATTARSRGCASTRRRATPTRPRWRRRRPRRSPWWPAPTCRGCSPAHDRARARTEPVVGATAEILEVLRDRGACFAAELGEATNRLPEDIERALWDGVARGLIMSDGFGAIRARVTSGARTAEVRRFSRLARGTRPANAAAGRWSLVPAGTGTLDGPTADGADRDELAEAVAELLLHRWGVVFRDLVVHDSIRFPWRDLQWALRRLEDRGLVRGGRFVTGFSGEQYALPAAIEQLAQARKQPRAGERVTVNATDPLNLVGVLLPGARVPAVRTNRVTFVDGLPATPDAESQADEPARTA